VLVRPLQSNVISAGFPERIREADDELKAVVSLQKQVGEKSRELAEAWISILRQVGLQVQIRKEAFGFQFGAVDEARLDPEGMVFLKISGDEVSYQLVELPSDTITAIVSNSAPELLGSLREMVKAEAARVIALERIALEFDRRLDVGAHLPRSEESPVGVSERGPPMAPEKGSVTETESAAPSRPKPLAKKSLADSETVTGSYQYAFQGSFGAPKGDPMETSSCVTNVSL
jgi:hypothetical protein